MENRHLSSPAFSETAAAWELEEMLGKERLSGTSKSLVKSVVLY